MPLISFHDNSFSFSDVKHLNKKELSKYELKTLNVVERWLNNERIFTLKTSGSTGLPKEISFTREDLEASAQLTINVFELKKDDWLLCCLDVDVVAGFMMIIRALVGGMNLLVFPPSKNPVKELENNQPIDFVSLVPLQLEEILKHQRSKQRLDGMKAVLLGGAPVNDRLIKKLQLVKCPVYQSYGMTETLSHVALKRLNGPEINEYYKALEGVYFKIDQRGCLVIEATHLGKEIITNDLVDLINNKTFKWIGRVDFVINSGGFKVNPEEVEGKLGEVLKEKNFFVTGIPDESLGEKVIVLVEGLSNSRLKLEMKNIKTLHPYEQPKEIYFVERFSLTDSGKVDRRKTLAQLEVQ